MTSRAQLLVDPHPRREDMIFTEATRSRLEKISTLAEYWGDGRMPDGEVEGLLPETDIIVGQTHLDRERIERAARLKAVINVKGNWEPWIDYRALAARGIHVLSIAPCMAPAVAEWSLGAAIDLGRGLTEAHQRFRAGTERYGIAGNGDAVSLYGAAIGLIGYGNLGRALVPLLRPFSSTIRVHDPWLSDGFLADQGVQPAALDAVLEASRFLFLLAGVTTANQGFLDERRLARIRHDACVVLASRAEIADFDALLRLADKGAFRLAVDVFPQEPVPDGSPWRDAERPLFSAHRAGGIRASYERIAEWMADDIEQILQGLPPLRLQRAEPVLAAAMRSR